MVSRFDEADQRILATLNNIRVIQKELDRYTEAHQTYEAVLKKKEVSLKKNDPSILATVMNIGIIYEYLREYEKAVSFLQRALCGNAKYFGKDRPKTINAKGNITEIYFKQGKVEDI